MPVVKTISSKISIVSRKKGQNAVEKSAYISRTTIRCERDGQVYYPKYKEDLIYSEVMLPEGAPEKLRDRYYLWNSIENLEKRKDAQMARTFRISLPNEWSHEFAVEVMRDYVRKNFTSQGMCCDFAIHNSRNKKSNQQNLHCHIMLTMRPLTAEGKWGDKQRFVYKLDKNGNKIRKKNGKGYEGHSEQTTDWNSKEKATEWRKDLAAAINSTNEKIGNTEAVWEWRSFKDRGLDILPEIHLGAKASALEEKGILTDRGNINRGIREANNRIRLAKERYCLTEKEYLTEKEMADKIRIAPAVSTSESDKETVENELMKMLDQIRRRSGRLALPIISSQYLVKISDRSRLQDIRYAENFVKSNHIETFDELKKYLAGKGKEFDRKGSQMLRNERAKLCINLAIAELISYNRLNLEREIQNEKTQTKRKIERENHSTQKKKNNIEI